MKPKYEKAIRLKYETRKDEIKKQEQKPAPGESHERKKKSG